MERYPGGAASASESSVDGSTETSGPWLAIDYGTKRVGVAITNPERTLSLPLCTLPRRNDRQLIAELVKITRREGVRTLVIGEPRRLDGSIGEAAERARRFAERLATRCSLPYRLVDEALTSHAAEERLRSAGIDPRKHPERVDQLAAQILLEETLARSQEASE